MKKRKLLEHLLAGSRNVRFADLVRLAQAFGFALARVNSSHHIFIHPEVPVPLNLQDVNGQAKPYQVRQFLALVERHNLKLEDGE